MIQNMQKKKNLQIVNDLHLGYVYASKNEFFYLFS